MRLSSALKLKNEVGYDAPMHFFTGIVGDRKQKTESQAGRQFTYVAKIRANTDFPEDAVLSGFLPVQRSDLCADIDGYRRISGEFEDRPADRGSHGVRPR